MFDDDDTFDAQNLINSGMAWRLEGYIGRQCMAAINDGACMLGKSGYRDYWGNYVPSRDEVQAGTKGSFDFVAERYGVEHAETQAAK
jgi:hypothetical protein